MEVPEHLLKVAAEEFQMTAVSLWPSKFKVANKIHNLAMKVDFYQDQDKILRPVPEKHMLEVVRIQRIMKVLLLLILIRLTQITHLIVIKILILLETQQVGIHNLQLLL